MNKGKIAQVISAGPLLIGSGCGSSDVIFAIDGGNNEQG